MEFPKQEYWSRLSFPIEEIFLTQRLTLHLLCLLHWQADHLPPCYLGIPMFFHFQFSHSVRFDPFDPKDCVAHQASLSIPNSQSLVKLMSIESVMPFIQLILCHPLLLLPSIFPSIRVFSNELVLHIRWPKYWSFHQSFQWIFRTDFLQDWLVWSPCCPRDSEESSPTPQLKSIN